MAHLRCDFRSEVLDMNTSMIVVLPEGVKIPECRVIYLFHGLADNCTGWSRYTSVERYARENDAVLIIPEVQRSFYTDMQFGLEYFRFIHDELPEICHRFFNVSRDASKNYVMGLSMGGYAALKCFFNTPDRYAGCATFSAVTDMCDRVTHLNEQSLNEFKALFGHELNVPDDCDIFFLIDQVNDLHNAKFYMACGEQDELFEQNKRLASRLDEKGADIRFEHWEGVHGWEFWDAAVCKAFRYMLSKA